MTLKAWRMYALAGLFVAAGCATSKDLYYWGEYEKLIQDAYVKPGSADTAAQIEKLTTGIQKAEATGKKVPPGIYAHLGFLYALEGKDAQSQAAFRQEEALYPESHILIEGMFKRAAHNVEKQ